jgi:hypothetical protein
MIQTETERKYYLFLDESGDHSLDKIDPQYPMFVLGGVLIHAADYNSIDARWKQMKLELFGRDDIVIHTADLTRNKNGFEKMKDKAFRDTVYAEFNAIMAELPYQIIGCAVRKDDHLDRYGVSAIDPYHLSLNVIVERAYFAVGKMGRLHIIAESRESTLDRMLEVIFLELKISGTHYISAKELNALGIEMHIRQKSKNISGLQMADLVVTPIGRKVLGKKLHGDWHVIESKLYRYRGKWEGAGLVVLPK